MAAVNFEHAWGDGVAILRLVNELYRDTTTRPYVPGAVGGAEGVPLRRLEFKLSEPLKKVIAEGRASAEKAASSLSINMVEHKQYGKKYLKKMNLSPDAILQLSLQVLEWERGWCKEGCVGGE